MRIPDVVSENRTFELFLSTKPSQPEKAVCHSFIIKKDKVSADSISTQNKVVEESSKSVKQVKIELVQI